MAHGVKNYFNGRYEVEVASTLFLSLTHWGALCGFPVYAYWRQRSGATKYAFHASGLNWFENLLCFESWHRGHKNYALKYLMSLDFSLIKCCLDTLNRISKVPKNMYNMGKISGGKKITILKLVSPFWQCLVQLNPWQIQKWADIRLTTHWISSLRLAESAPRKQLRAGWLHLCTNVCLKRSELHNNVIIIVMRG